MTETHIAEDQVKELDAQGRDARRHLAVKRSHDADCGVESRVMMASKRA